MIEAKQTVLVWDIAVRAFHWSLVVLFATAYLTGEDGGQWHVYAGYGVAGLVVFRVVWGIIGTRHARFSDFVYPPRVVWAYLRSMLEGHPKRYLGHNPAGGAMVIVLLVALALVCWSGLVVYGEEGQGPLAKSAFSVIALAYADEDEDEGKHDGESDAEGLWEAVHETLSNLTVLLAAMHVLGVAVSSMTHGENLVRAMIHGRKAVRDDESP